MMEKMKGLDKRAQMINELLEGMEFAKQLRDHFSNPTNINSCSSSNNDDNQAHNYSLLEKMLSSFDKTLQIAKLLHFQFPQDFCFNKLESPHSLTSSSPRSENSHPNYPPSKRRRSMMPKWSKTVKISNGGVISGLEGDLNDGFSWRKYGQKDILNAKFPRGYYRCTFRPSRGCEATKQVQRSNEDPSIYQIMYRGEHTCAQGAHLSQAQQNPISPTQIFKSEPQPPPSPQPSPQPTPQQHEVYVGLSPEGDLKVEPEQEADNRAQIFRCFSFTSAHIQPDPFETCMSSLIPAFGSPRTSESNCASVTPPTGADMGLTVQTSETDVNEAASGPNSVTNSPIIGDFEFSIDDLLDFGNNLFFKF